MCACPTYKVVDDHMRGSLIVLACKLVDHHSCSKIIGQLADSISVNYSIDSSFNHCHLAPPNPFSSMVLVRDFDVVWYGGEFIAFPFGFQRPILGRGERVEAQIQELRDGRGGFTTHASPIICIGFIIKHFQYFAIGIFCQIVEAFSILFYRKFINY